DEPKWHYRRSLASRVILLTTMAVGFAVALVALGAYWTVKMSLQSSLDDSLLARAHLVSQKIATATVTGENIPSWTLTAGDVYFVRSDGWSGPADLNERTQLTAGPPETQVASGQSSESVRTIRLGSTDYRVAAVRYSNGYAVVLAQNIEPQESTLKRMGAVML